MSVTLNTHRQEPGAPVSRTSGTATMPSRRRYQVFVSSTYTDLQEARAEVMQALLELDCMPAGMELFPAASEEQWSWIRKVIDESDYYVVVVGGRYGSISERTGLSFTEMEYRYALEAGKPTLAFLHEDPSSLPAGQCEASAAGKRKLQQFRELLEKRLCKYWTTPADLGAKLSRGITQLMNRQPAVGWVRADEVPQDQTRELLALQRELVTMRERLQAAGLTPDQDGRELARGGDTYALRFVAAMKQPRISARGHTYWVNAESFHGEVEATWDEIFLSIATDLHAEDSEGTIVRRVGTLVHELAESIVKAERADHRMEYVVLDENSRSVVMLQLRALGLLETTKSGYWKLTTEGERYLIRLRAVHRSGGHK